MADNLSDEMRAMLAATEREYIGWDPAVLPTFVGTVADIIPDCDCGGFGTHYIISVDLPDGNGLNMHCFHATLRSQIEPKIKSSRLGVGDLIAVAHKGEKDSTVKGHAPMNMYSVVVRQKPPATQFFSDGRPVE
jgi:hypothetical protein